MSQEEAKGNQVNDDSGSDSDSGSSEEVAPPPPVTPRLALEKLPVGEERIAVSHDKETSLFENIELTLRFPDGAVRQVKAVTGEYVSGIKRRLHDEGWVKYDDVNLFVRNKQMLDPLSLNDFPEIVKDKSPIEVRNK